MKLRILGSNSSGNSYILENDNEALLIEAGIDFRVVKKALGYNLRKVVGAVISHRHGDHAKFVASLVKSGIQTLALEDVFASHGIDGNPFSHSVIPNKSYKVGGFICTPFAVSHDVPCVGWLIKHDEFGKLLFVTDTMKLDYQFDGLTEIMIETNYADDILDGRLERDEINLQMYKRIINSHMSLSTAKYILKSNDLSQVDNIVLIHLSNGSSDEQRFVSEIKRLTGKQVTAADKGVEIELLIPY
jgi:phosphoribosyl 1,2-cyclic phosphodiesterase